MIKKGFKFSRAPANALVPCKNDPAFPSRDLKPFFVRGIGRKTLVVCNVMRTKLVKGLTQQAAPGAAINE
ncbi:MAG: hypothetical protein WCA45_10730 [Thiobacillaceae bacterium]